MNDKTLLELAAKAAGIELVDIKQRSDNPYSVASGKPWNPLTDDGDALRLAVKLGMDIGHVAGQVYANDVFLFYCDYNHDPCVATRRAIVRAAAEVGKGMLTQDEFIRMFPGRFDDVTVAAAIAEQGEKE